MRLRRLLATVALVVLAVPAGTAVALTPMAGAVADAGVLLVRDGSVRDGARGRQPSTCGDPRSADFPLGTRIHGGPDTYRPGGDSAEWYLDLTNTTDATCHGIHPVLVLVDDGRNLAAAHARAEFYDTATDSWHRVPFLRTEEDELVGVFGEGALGFSVGAGRTVSVRVRLGFGEDARPNSVVATAAVVQRRKDDGDWVGRSADYRFAVDPDAETGTGAGTSTSAGTGKDPGTGTGTGADIGPGTGTGTGDSGRSEGYAVDAGSLPALAQSGPRPVSGLGGTAAALLLGGGVLVVGARRVRARALTPTAPKG